MSAPVSTQISLEPFFPPLYRHCLLKQFTQIFTVIILLLNIFLCRKHLKIKSQYNSSVFLKCLKGITDLFNYFEYWFISYYGIFLFAILGPLLKHCAKTRLDSLINSFIYLEKITYWYLLRLGWPRCWEFLYILSHFTGSCAWPQSKKGISKHWVTFHVCAIDTCLKFEESSG